MIKFGSKTKTEKIIAPITGIVTDLNNVPDPVFSEKMIGEGIAIYPKAGKVVAPADGEIIQLFPTKHAIGILTDKGLEILIHIGLDTVNLKGKGFTAYVAQGERVSAGQKLIDFDIPYISENAASTVVPIIITNTDVLNKLFITEENEVSAGKDMLIEALLTK